MLQSWLVRPDKLGKPCEIGDRHCSKDDSSKRRSFVVCVLWYLRYALSYRDLEELMAERNLRVDHVTIWRWVQHHAPELAKRCRRELRRTNASWRVDETYLRVAGEWTYLDRAVDSQGNTIDFLLSPNRDAAAAKWFFRKASRASGHPHPRVTNVDGNPAYPSHWRTQAES